MSSYVLVVYRHAVATIVIAPFAVFLDKKVMTKITRSTFIKIIALSLLELVIDQNLYILGMKYPTATFAAAIINILPAITFIVACIVGLETVKIRSIHSQAKVAGTIATVAGAMIMTLIKGQLVELFWTRGTSYHHQHETGNSVSFHDSIKGPAMIVTGNFSCAALLVFGGG